MPHNAKSIPIFLTHEEGSKSVFFLLKFWGKGARTRDSGLMEGLENRWNGKEKEAFKTSFQKTPVNCLWLIFPAFPLGRLSFTKARIPP